MDSIIKAHENKLFSINGVSDHVHVLISMNPKQAPSDLMYHLKRSSSIWINDNKLCPRKFAWQEGFGAFSYGKSQIPTIAKYIEKQKRHHLKKTFYDEYIAFLKAFEIDYDERYVYKPIL
jgi:REP element-mobilizing transposase RayT